MEIPTDLPPVPAKTVRVFGVRFEVHNHPVRLFQECEVDHGLKDASRIVLYQDRQFAVGATGVAGAVKERMLQRGGDALGGGMNFFIWGAQ